jgi:hypothetical protein
MIAAFSKGLRAHRPQGIRTGLLVFLAAGAGCVTLGSSVHDSPPTGPVAEITVTWDNTVTFVPDCVHGGTPNPGLLGRLYLFGADVKYPLAGDGTMHVELYDDTPLTWGGPAVLKAKWDFDKVTLKGCLRKDLVGWGYTFFLPWETYSPEVKQIHFKMCYAPQQGFPHYDLGKTIVLKEPDGAVAPTARPGPQPGMHDQPAARLLAPATVAQTAGQKS